MQAGFSARGFALWPLAVQEGKQVHLLSDNSHMPGPALKLGMHRLTHRDPWKEVPVPTLQLGELRPRGMTWPEPDC